MKASAVAIYKNAPITEGMHATQCVGSDCYPYEVVKVISKTRVAVRRMLYKRLDNNGPFTEDQTYEYSSDVEGIAEIATMGRNGDWKLSGCHMGFGFARMHRDPHF